MDVYVKYFIKQNANQNFLMLYKLSIECNTMRLGGLAHSIQNCTQITARAMYRNFQISFKFSGKVDYYLLSLPPLPVLMGMSGILGQNVSDNRDFDYSIDRLSLLFLFFRLLCVK